MSPKEATLLKRGSGVLLHISSLPSPYGIGDFGPQAFQFVDFLHEAGQSYWQVLPLNPTDGVYGHSPYSSHSAFAGNTLFISPQEMVKEGWLADADLDSPPFSGDAVHYERGLLDKKAENAISAKTWIQYFDEVAQSLKVHVPKGIHVVETR